MSYSQASPEDKLGAWYTVNIKHLTSEKTSVNTCVQLRSFEVFDNLALMFYCVAGNYDFNKKTTVSLGYAYLDIDKTFAVSGENHLYENRIYEQIYYKHQLYKIPIYQRLRLEHRFLNFRHIHTTEHRFRYQLGSKINLNKTLFLNVNNDLFINLQDEIFTENRLYGALGINLTKANNIQLGYMNRKVNGQNLHRLQLGIFLKTDFRKQNKL